MPNVPTPVHPDLSGEIADLIHQAKKHRRQLESFFDAAAEAVRELDRRLAENESSSRAHREAHKVFGALKLNEVLMDISALAADAANPITSR